MGIFINTNVPAINSANQLNKSKKKSNKNLEKLASGFKINSASDNASGLGISEKMRAQISALDTITGGVEDGINLVSTADGYLEEIQNMLVRMTELSMESANGILQDDPDRQALQEEMNRLGAEIDRIADTANFNGNKLFSPKEIVERIVEKTEHVTNTYKTMEGTQYFSTPSSFMELGDNTLHPNMVDKEIQNKADTLKVLSNAVSDYMKSQTPTLTNMVKGKIYYNKDGQTLIDAPEPCTKTDDEITNIIGAPYYSVNTYPDREIIKYTVHHDAIDIPETYVPEVVHPPIVHPAVVHPEVPGSYKVKGLDKSKLVDGDEKGSITLSLINGTTEAYKNAHRDEGINCLVGKSVYYKKDGSSAVVDDSSNGGNYPDSEYYNITFDVVPDKPSWTEPGWTEPGWTEPGYTIPAVHVDAWDEEKTEIKNRKYKQSYIDQTISYTVKERYETKKLPITLQVGETSDKADKITLGLYDIHTDKLFEEYRELLGYEKVLVHHPEVPPEVDFDNVGGDMDNTDGSSSFKPGTPEYDTLEEDKTRPIYYVEDAIRDNTDTSPYKDAVTLDISTQQYALSNVTHARRVNDKISLIRGQYGAIGNRLERIVNTHENTVENVSAAKSLIKDTDMAEEMMKYIQNNIMMQTSQAMLAQANVKPQHVLQLLQ